MKIAIVGGDLRSRFLLEELIRSGFACGSAALGGPSVPLEKLADYGLIVAPGIPGKKAPLSVARVMMEITLEYLREKKI